MKTSKSNTKLLKQTEAQRKREVARIKKDNAAFAKLSPAKKRVLIAEDVLAQMSTGYIKPMHETFATFKKHLPKNKPELQLQEFLNQQKSCEVCGIGSLFVCAVRRFDNLVVSKVLEASKEDIIAGRAMEGDDSEKDDSDYVTITTVLQYLKGFFSENQLMHIEIAFESGHGYFHDRPDYLDERNYENFRLAETYFNESDGFLRAADSESEGLSAELRMKLIMQNIIKNRGTFKFGIKDRPKLIPVVTIAGF